jgi:hypothetical protein
MKGWRAKQKQKLNISWDQAVERLAFELKYKSLFKVA